MFKYAIALIVIFSINDVVHAQKGSEIQQWECALNLQQGDAGTMSLDRAGESIEGLISINRNQNVFESRVNGTWINKEINLSRLMDANSSEPMAGIVITLGTRKVKIGGRFSTEYQGVWSADCDLVSEIVAVEESVDTPADLPPSTTSRVSPNSPSNKDRITFSALASHPDGIESVSFFLGNDKIHSCDTSKCNTSYGPVSEGKYKWRVEAISKSGVKSPEIINDLVVRNSAVTDKCTISGSATGASADQSPLYLVNLFGPDNAKLFREAMSFTNGRYQFSNLPAGNYLLKVDTQIDAGVLSSPSSITVNCQSQSNLKQDFSFN